MFRPVAIQSPFLSHLEKFAKHLQEKKEYEQKEIELRNIKPEPFESIRFPVKNGNELKFNLCWYPDNSDKIQLQQCCNNDGAYSNTINIEIKMIPKLIEALKYYGDDINEN